MKTRILVVADDAALRAMLARGLLQAGYAVELAESARHAREVITRESVALAILAPRGVTEVTELAHELKDKIGRLVLVTEGDQTLEASLGALVSPDSRIKRPFTEQVLLAKIKSELNAAAPIAATRADPAGRPRVASANGPLVLTFEGYTLDAEARSCIYASGREVALTRAEFSLLLALARQPGRVLSRDELSHVVAGRAAEPDDRSVDVLISRLRRKIEPDARTPRIIVTMPGEGYKFTARPDPVDPSKSNIVAPSPASGTAQAVADEAHGPRAEKTGKPRLWVGASAVAIILVALAGWTAWQTRTVSRQLAQVASSASSPPASTSTAALTTEQERRATVYKRMVTAMQDDHYNWRTVERLAIESGVEEVEAHEILAEHPDEVVLGKSHEGKLLARLADR